MDLFSKNIIAYNRVKSIHFYIDNFELQEENFPNGIYLYSLPFDNKTLLVELFL
jgi:hypothetical protein